MNNRDRTPLRPAGPARGLLRTPARGEHGEHRRVLPDEALAPYVAHFWWVRWSLDVPAVAETLPHPCVHLLLEESGGRRRAEASGVHTARFVRTLSGEGFVFGVKLRPAMFRALHDEPAAALAERVVPLRRVLGRSAERWVKEVFEAGDMAARVAIASRALAGLTPPSPPSRLVHLRDLVERIAVDRELLRVEDVARAAAMGVRPLQRAFRDAVGVSPKWVLGRYRLHEAAERLAAARPPPLSELAQTLGYADQAHFTRDFKAVTGRTPGEYVAARRSRA